MIDFSNFDFSGVVTSIFLVTIGDVMVLEKSNIRNPIKCYDTFEISKLHFFSPYKHGLRRRINKQKGSDCKEERQKRSNYRSNCKEDQLKRSNCKEDERHEKRE
jgi:hypothetical protein